MSWLALMTNVATWHAEMGDWLHANDPFRHLVTTSMTGGSDRPEIWSLPQMDFSMYHSYSQPDPALGLSARIRSFRERYSKPMMIGEFGVDWQGWDYADDPHLRGMRQGVWAGVLGGSVGPGDGTVRLAIVGDPGVGYELEGSTNLTDWSRVGTASNAVGEAVWETASDLPRQLFRGRVPP